MKRSFEIISVNTNDHSIVIPVDVIIEMIKKLPCPLFLSTLLQVTKSIRFGIFDFLKNKENKEWHESFMANLSTLTLILKFSEYLVKNNRLYNFYDGESVLFLHSIKTSLPEHTSNTNTRVIIPGIYKNIAPSSRSLLESISQLTRWCIIFTNYGSHLSDSIFLFRWDIVADALVLRMKQISEEKNFLKKIVDKRQKVIPVK